MKKIIIALTLITAALLITAGCVEQENVKNELTVPIAARSGEISSFSLINPTDGEEVMVLPEFTWQKAENADRYEIEVASSADFSQTDDAVYVKKTGITDTHFTLYSTIKEKNVTYYWRVTAVNENNRKRSDTGTFYLKADESEIEFDVNYADEWTVHEQGSAATVSVDDSDFFGNGKNSLVVSFVEEDVKRGIPSSDGWIVITHSQETEMYGVNAFFFNFYYSGNDADVYLRVVDEDNEYWHAQIKLATNAKQTVIIRFEDFELRTKGGTTIANQVFDYNYIKYVELVFEKSFGDGVAMMSDLRAIKYENYGHLFIDSVNFANIAPENVVHDNYNFSTEIKDDGKTLTYGFSGAANENNAKGINGYGFVKYTINKLLVNGDAFAFGLECEGNINSATVLIRLIEEDGDRWVYRQKVSLIPEDKKLVVPFMAFTLSEYHGDASRQFYYVKQLQFGVEGVYSTGSITVSDFRVTSLSDEIANLYVSEIDDNGLIDDFNGYGNNVDPYYKWKLSETNKDEAIAIDKELAFGSGNTCVKLGYKADMGQAMYGTMFASPTKEYNALSLWAMDRSVKSDNAAFNYLDEVCAQMIVSLYVSTGEEYYAAVDAVAKYWTEYVIAFSDFTLAEGYYGNVTPLASENIVGIKIGFQYYYYAKSGTLRIPSPTYISNNYVYIDNVGFTTAEKSGKRELMHKLVPSAENGKVCVVEDFDTATYDTLSFKGERGYDYEVLTLSERTASGEGQSLIMGYRGKNESVAYAMATVFDTSVEANCVKFLLKGDGKATVYINIYMLYAGTTYKYRATLTAVSSEWMVYTIGFDNFQRVEGKEEIYLIKDKVQYITKITFGIVNGADDEDSEIILDKLTFDGTLSDRQGYKINSIEDYEGQL
ncbi:MAG: hypothetical protein J5762_02425 [Clostridia bacterium]|nr:hypothetical protein [Clostridia bacterium]